MPFSVRLDPDTEALIDRLARNQGRTRAWVVREAVAHYAVEGRDAETLYERMKAHVGTYKSGNRTLSEDTGDAFTRHVHAKARARRSVTATSRAKASLSRRSVERSSRAKAERAR